MEWVSRRLAIACCIIGLSSPAPAAAAPRLPLAHAGRFVTDARGRVVVIHGINEVSKLPPYDPLSTGFDDDDAAFLARNGFNAVRVGVIWKAVEPQPGVYDDRYLDRISATVRTLARHNIASLIDFHQDLLNEKFGGEGWPDWAVIDDGLPAQPLLGFPLSYVSSPGLNQAMANFYANAPGPGGVGIQDRFAAAWHHVASLFAANRSVLGYDLFNEPWPGSANIASCYSASGCPDFEQKLLAPMEARVMRAIRQVDRTDLLWYEPSVSTQAGLSKYTIPNPTGDHRAGMSFHVYCLPIPSRTCSEYEQTSLDEAIARGQANGDALLETEWGATADLALIDRQVARDDRALMSWMWWAYTGNDPTTSGGGGAQAIVADPTKPPTGTNIYLDKLEHLVEPYPQAISGTPTAWSFDRGTSTFRLTYSLGKAGGKGSFHAGSVTEVSTPALVYPHGYAARVRGGAIVSARRAAMLTVVACPHVKTISAIVARSGRRGGSCKLRLRLAISPRVAQPGHATRFRFLVSARLGSFSMRARGVTVSFAGRRVRTNREGRASIRITLDRSGRYPATARGQGYVRGRIVITL
jgi:endoglycosylceramidase